MQVPVLFSFTVLWMFHDVSCLQCYRCDMYFPQYGCSQTTQCSRDEVCYMSFAKSASTGATAYTSGCMAKQACQTFLSSMVGKRGVLASGACFNCCSTTLCNNNCNTTNAPTPTSAPVAVSTSCVDFTSPTTCKLASSIVCKDITTATNAGCRHYCGLC